MTKNLDRSRLAHPSLVSRELFRGHTVRYGRIAARVTFGNGLPNINSMMAKCVRLRSDASTEMEYEIELGFGDVRDIAELFCREASASAGVA
jgi:hypothetical protein